MGDVTDIEGYRDKMREAVKDTETEDDSLIRCPHCEDLMTMVCFVPDYTEVDSGGPYALICQHCSEPLGAAYLFTDEELEDL